MRSGRRSPGSITFTSAPRDGARRAVPRRGDSSGLAELASYAEVAQNKTGRARSTSSPPTRTSTSTPTTATERRRDPAPRPRCACSRAGTSGWSTSSSEASTAARARATSPTTSPRNTICWPGLAGRTPGTRFRPPLPTPTVCCPPAPAPTLERGFSSAPVPHWTLPRLLKEISECGVEPGSLSIDPQAMIIEAADVEAEQGLVSGIGSTGKGGGARSGAADHGPTRRRPACPARQGRTRTQPRTSGQWQKSSMRPTGAGDESSWKDPGHGAVDVPRLLPARHKPGYHDVGLPGRGRHRLEPGPQRHHGLSDLPDPGHEPGRGHLRTDEAGTRLERDRPALRHVGRRPQEAERGSVSGTQRRVAEFDWELLRSAAELNGATEIAPDLRRLPGQEEPERPPLRPAPARDDPVHRGDREGLRHARHADLHPVRHTLGNRPAAPVRRRPRSCPPRRARS